MSNGGGEGGFITAGDNQEREGYEVGGRKKVREESRWVRRTRRRL